MESDFWSDDDLADISSHTGGGKDNNISSDRGAVFMAHYNIENNSLWGDKVITFLEINHNKSEVYYYTSGLMDGSYYRDENDASVSFQIWYEEETMHYAPDEMPITITQITDTHISATDNRSWDNLEKVIEDINKIQPNLVLVTGDLVDGASSENYKKFVQIMTNISSGIDVEYIVGNHDIRINGNPLQHDYAWYHYYITPQSDKVVIDKYYKYGYVFLGLDSNEKLPITNDFNGELNETQLDWLYEELNYYNKSKQIIVFMHHPVFAENDPIWGDPTISDNLTAKDKFIDYCIQPDKNGYSKVSLVLTGHVHLNGVWEENGKDQSGRYPKIGKKLVPMEIGYYNNFYDKKTKFIHTASVIDYKAYRVIQLYGENAVYRTYFAPSDNPLPSIENVTVFPSSVINWGDKVFIYATVNGGKSGIKFVKCFWSSDKIKWNSLKMENINPTLHIYKIISPINTSTLSLGEKIFIKVAAENWDNYVAVGNATFTVINPTLVNITPCWQQVNVNDTFVVNITVTPTLPIAGMQFDLHFNASLLEVVSVEEGNLFAGYSTFFSNGSIDNENGTIKDVYGAILGGGGVNNYGTFAKITFKAKKEGFSYLNLSDVVVGDANAQPVEVKINNGSVEIVARLWDLNGDGTINVLDLIIVAMHFGATEGNGNYAKEADLNGDGVINVLDLIVVAMHFGEKY